MKNRFLSLLCVLALCLGLLPATAEAAAPSGQVIYVGNENVTNGGYWTTDSDGNVIASTAGETPTDNYIHYDAENNVLTLHNATIRMSVSIETNTLLAGAAIGVLNQYGDGNAELTITLEGTNTIAEVGKGIYVLASSTGEATLTITGDGSLDASASQTGIWVQSNSGNATLTIRNAKVEATGTSTAGYGVNVQSSNSSTAALTVDGGSLTASGSPGILYDSIGSGTVPNTTTLTISKSAIVDAREGGIGAGLLQDLKEVSPADDSVGIVFDGDDGTVYGNATLQEDLEIGEGESLTLDDGASLNAGDYDVIVDGGTLDDSIKNSLGDSVKYAPDIQTESLPNGTEGTSYSQTLTATGTAPITWSVTSGSLPAGLSLNGNTISGTPTAQGTSNFTVTATNAYGSDSKEFTLTIDQQGTIHVTSVSLDKTSLELTEGGTGTLIATVEPNNATNKNVTWESSNTSVATVDANGEVTAVSAGTATITVTTADGGFTATCEVTVKPAEYTVTVLTDGKGSASASPSTAEAGTTVTLTADPDNGWRFSRWEVVEGDVTISGNSFTMPADNVTVRAVFSPIVNIPDTYDIDLIVGEGGEARLSLSNASEGSTITVTATPDVGYELDYITVDGERISGTTFKMPGHDVTVRVYFTDDAALPFTDVSAGAWYFDAVGYVYVGGLMDGVSDTLFDPDGTMTRAMVWAILARVDGETVTGEDWIETARDWAVAEGVSDGENATDYVTREQFATMLWRYASGKGYDVSIGEDTNILSYADFADLSEYAIPAMQWACGAGVITGVTDATLVPQGEATRAQVAAMLMRFVEAIG